jgi:hypothetical protein
MKRYPIIAILLVLGFVNCWSLDFKSNTFISFSEQILNPISSYNLDNTHLLRDMEFYAESGLSIYSRKSLGAIASGMINLVGQYYTLRFGAPFYNTPDWTNGGEALVPWAHQVTDTQKFFIKDMYIDIRTDYFSIRAGKQYISWSKADFFNPIDVMNLKRDLITPIDQLEGIPFLSFRLPFTSALSLELLTRTSTQDAENLAKGGNPISFLNLPILARFSYSELNFDFFLMVMLDAERKFGDGRKPIFGFSGTYSMELMKNLTMTLLSELTLKTTSYRQRVTPDGTLKTFNDPFYFATLLGAKTAFSTPTFFLFDGIELNFDFYYDGENWGAYDFENYLYATSLLAANPNPSLESLRTNRLAADYYNATGLREDFRNSKFYIYTDLGLNNFMVHDLKPRVFFIMNLDDYSFILAPQVTYTFKDPNLIVGCKVPFFIGKETGQKTIPKDPKDRTEFGTEWSQFRMVIFMNVAI